MCWHIEITVVLEKDIPSVRAAFREPERQGLLRLEGDFPIYWVVNEQGCACGAVEESTTGVTVTEESLAFVEDLILQEPVKRLHVRVWWGDGGERPGREEARLDWPDFQSLNGSHQLTPGVVYRVNNLAKYRH